MSEVLEKAKELVDEIYSCMTKVENCETLSEEVAAQEVVLVKAGSDRYIKLNGVLSEEQIQEVKKYIQNMIDINKAAAEQFLQRLSGTEDGGSNCMDVAESVEKTEQEKAEENKKEAGQEKAVKTEEERQQLSVEAVKEVYTEGDMTIIQAAEHFGVSKNKLYKFVSENGLRKPKKDNTPWRDRDCK